MLKKSLKKCSILIIFCSVFNIARPVYAFFDPTGPAQVMYLTKILLENYKRYKQLREMMDQSKFHRDWIRNIHAGLENAGFLLESLPVKDEKILSQLRTLKESLSTIEEIYGVIPKSKEEIVQRLHDNTVAESLRMIHDFQKYAEKQESNSIIIASNSRQASPKGAARIAATTNAEILRSLSQLIRLNSQMLKLQGEQLAFKNKIGKSKVSSYQQVNNDLGTGFKKYSPNLDLPTF